MKKIYIIAGEPSGDFIGSELIAALCAQEPHINIRGIGGDLMSKTSMTPFFHADQIAVMGLIELIPHLFRIKRLIQHTINDIIDFKPDILVTIDAPGFCNRIITGVKKHGRIPCIHYVAPSVWAWRPKRAQKLAHDIKIDHLLCLFPFEPDYFTVHGLSATHVGHPIINMNWTCTPSLYDQLQLNQSRKTICVLPGSRAGEIKRHISIFARAIDELDVNIVVPTFDHFSDIIKSHMPYAHIITDPALKRKAMCISNVALAASGTVSLELAMAQTPMIIAYRASPITAWIVRRLIKIPSVCLVNILLKRKIVQEYLQEACNATDLKHALMMLLNGKNTDGTHHQQTPEMYAQIHACLTPNDNTQPAQKAAEVILNYAKTH